MVQVVAFIIQLPFLSVGFGINKGIYSCVPNCRSNTEGVGKMAKIFEKILKLSMGDMTWV